MYAVIKTGGKQYRVAKDQIVEIERLPGEAGQAVEFKDVLMAGEGAIRQNWLAKRRRRKSHRRNRQAVARTEGHRLRQAPPQEFAPQEGPPSRPDTGQDHRHFGVSINQNSNYGLALCSCRPNRGRQRHGTKESRRLDKERPRFRIRSASASRSSAASTSFRATSSAVSAARNGIPAAASASAPTTPSTLCLKATSISQPSAMARSSSRSSQQLLTAAE